MKIAKLAAGILLAALTAYACSQRSNQAGGSNTNWFATCDSASNCSGGLECWCGICTKTCADDCNAVSGATCSAPPPSCANPAEAAKEKACAVQCTKDADCKEVAADATCVQTICRRKASIVTHPDSGPPLTCDEITNQAQAALQPLRAVADKSCRTNADCVEFPGLSCTNHCSTAIVSKGGLSAVQSEIDAVEQGVCSQFVDQGCSVVEPPCTSPIWGCVNGTCEYDVPGAQSDGGPSSCDVLWQQLSASVPTASDGFRPFSQLDRSCYSDADCTSLQQPGLSCIGGCVGPASKTIAAAFEAARSQFEDELCTPYLAAGCSYRIEYDDCPPPAGDTPQCINGVCELAPDDGGLDCAERTTQMFTDLQPTVQTADKKCEVDADCDVVMLANACMESCTYVPASTQGAAAIRAELDVIETRSCPGFTQAGCTVQRKPCVAPPTTKCKAGVCEVL